MSRFHFLVIGLTLNAALSTQAQVPSQPKTPQQQSPKTRRLDNRELGDGLAPGRRSFFVLLKNPAIVEELELTDEQKDKIKDAEQQRQEAFATYNKDYQQKILDAQERDKQKEIANPPQTNQEKIERLNNNETKAVGQAHTETLNRLSNEADDAIARKILDRKQARRLREIQAQAEGPTYFERPEIQESLALEPDQLAEINRISSENRAQMRAATVIPANVAKPTAGTEQTLEAKTYASALENTRINVMKLRISTMKAIEQVLSKPQRGKYKTMVGKPFSFYQPKNDKETIDPVKKADSSAK